MEIFQDKVILSENDTIEDRVFTFETFALQLQEVDSETYQGQSFFVDLGSIDDVANITGRIPDDSLILQDTIMETFSNATASVLLPEDLLDDLVTCNETNSSTVFPSTRLSYSTFLSDVLFQNTEVTQYRLGSIIVAVRINCGTNTSLNTSILTTFKSNETVR